MSKATGASRTYGIDLLRGVACATVVLFHYLSRGPRAGWMAGAPLPVLEPVARYGYLGVHLFFMVSGYVIFMSAVGRSPRDFVASRVARLYPALWVAATITMLVIVASRDARFTVTWPEFLWNLTLIPQYVGARYVDGAYWSLAVELQFYILVWIALRARLMDNVDWLLWGWLLISLVDALRPMYPVERWLIANWAPLFVIGATTFRITTAGWSLQRSAMLMAAIALALYHEMLHVRRLEIEWHGDGPILAIVCAILLLATLAFVLTGVGRITIGRTRWATVPGALTYPVYLIHQFVGYVTFDTLITRGVSPFAALCAIIAIVIAIGAALHYCVETRIAPRIRRLISGQRSALRSAAA